MKRLSKWRLFSTISGTSACSLWLWRTTFIYFEPAGEVAKQQYDLMMLSTAIMVGVIASCSCHFLICHCLNLEERMTKFQNK